jgi:hypothetical protein
MVVYKPRTVTPQIYLRMPVEITEYVFGPEASNYIREVVMCLREVDSAVVYASVCDLLLYCSFNNSIFTNHVIKNIMVCSILYMIVTHEHSFCIYYGYY